MVLAIEYIKKYKMFSLHRPVAKKCFNDCLVFTDKLFFEFGFQGKKSFKIVFSRERMINFEISQDIKKICDFILFLKT